MSVSQSTRSSPSALRLALVPLALVFSSMTARPVDACSVPVFRYALERWAPDLFRALIVHKGELSESDRELIATLHLAGKTPTNLEPDTIDLGDEDALENQSSGVREVCSSLGEISEPQIVLLPPLAQKSDRVMWKGPLRDAEGRKKLLAVIDSPARRAISKNILSGKTATWIYLESGDKKKDDEVFAKLEGILRKLEKELELPEQPGEDDPPDPSSELRFSKLKLQRAFATLRVSRTDPAEKAFVDQLLATEPDLVDEGNKPMVFPIYGRGRALWAYVDAGIHEETIADAASFLVGPCSCEIKGKNPGVDLLMAADWEGALTTFLSARDEPIPDLAGFEGFTNPAGVSVGAAKKGEVVERKDPAEETTDESVQTIRPEVEPIKPEQPRKTTEVAIQKEDDAGESKNLEPKVTQVTPPEKIDEVTTPIPPAPEKAGSSTPVDTSPAKDEASTPSADEPGLRRNLVLLGLAALLIVAGVSVALTRKRG